MPTRDVVFPAGRQALYERNRYSPAVRSNGFLFVSGQVGSHEDRLARARPNRASAPGIQQPQRRAARCGLHV